MQTTEKIEYTGNLLFHKIKLSEAADNIHLIIPFTLYQLLLKNNKITKTEYNIYCLNKEECDKLFVRLTHAVTNHLLKKYYESEFYPIVKIKVEKIIVKSTGISTGLYNAFHLEIGKDQMFILPDSYLLKIGK